METDSCVLVPEILLEHPVAIQLRVFKRQPPQMTPIRPLKPEDKMPLEPVLCSSTLPPRKSLQDERRGPLCLRLVCRLIYLSCESRDRLSLPVERRKVKERCRGSRCGHAHGSSRLSSPAAPTMKLQSRCRLRNKLRGRDWRHQENSSLHVRLPGEWAMCRFASSMRGSGGGK